MARQQCGIPVVEIRREQSPKAEVRPSGSTSEPHITGSLLAPITDRYGIFLGYAVVQPALTGQGENCVGNGNSRRADFNMHAVDGKRPDHLKTTNLRVNKRQEIECGEHSLPVLWCLSGGQGHSGKSRITGKCWYSYLRRRTGAWPKPFRSRLDKRKEKGLVLH